MAKDKPVYAFIRKGDAMMPEAEYDMAALDGIAQGQRVKLDIQNFRNNGRLRAYWMMIRKCVDATGCAPTPQALHEAVKMMVGLVTYVTKAKGFPIGVPDSIAFEKMSEAEMISYFKAAEQVLASEFGFVHDPAERMEGKAA